MSLEQKIADNDNLDEIGEEVRAASDLLRALAHETRLMILCLLAEGEKSVIELQEILRMRQPSVSQQLARLRFDRLVTTRKDGRTIYYSLASSEAKKVVTLLYNLYCEKKS